MGKKGRGKKDDENMKPLSNKTKLEYSAQFIARLWMLQQPTEMDIGRVICDLCECLGDEYREMVVDYVLMEDPDFTVDDGLQKPKELK
jgi:hypothetical protein